MSTKIEVLSRRDSDAITTSLLLNDRAVFVWSGGMVSDGGPVTKMEELAASLLVSHGVRELLVSDVSTRTVVVSVMPQRYRVTPAGHDSFHSMVSGSREAAWSKEPPLSPEERSVLQVLSVVEEASGHMKTIGDHEFPEDVVAGEQWRPPTSEGREAWASAQEEAFLKEQAAQTKKASPMEAARLRFASMRGGGPKKA